MDKLKFYIRKFLVWLWVGKKVSFAKQDNTLNVYQRSAKAKELLDNPLYQEVIIKLKRDSLALWENTNDNSKEIREFLWIYIKILNQINSRFEGILNEIEVEKAQLNFKQQGRID